MTQQNMGAHSKNLDDQSLAADRLFDLALTAQWQNNWLSTFNSTKTKLIKIHTH